MGAPIQPTLFPLPSARDPLLGTRLRNLAESNIWIGTSSWKYPGWLDQIYTRDRYYYRGKFSQKRFEAECLAEYAETFPTVCGDFSFYQYPTPEFWQKLFATAPGSLRFALKAPEEVTVEVFPKHARYGPRAGLKNETYLNADVFQALFLELLAPYASRISTVIFEFGTRGTSPRDFVHQLEGFLSALPPAFRYAVEVRNSEYLSSLYFDCLRTFNTAHVYNAWTRMPTLSEQMAIPHSLTTDFTVVRALLRRGRAYEDAVASLAPYDKIQDENPEAREALRALIRRMKEERRAAHIYVNNRFEGNAPDTIRAVIDE